MVGSFFWVISACIAQGDASGQVEQSVKKHGQSEPRREPTPSNLQDQPAPAEQEPQDVRFKVRAFLIEGNKSIPTGELQALIAEPEEREMTLSEVKAKVQAIGAYYRTNGLLARAYIPEQEVKDGIVRIIVVEARFGCMQVEGNEHYTSEFILGHLRFDSGDVLHLGRLELGLRRLNDYPGLNVQATLRPGGEPGTTDVLLSAQDLYPLRTSVTYDNFGAETVSEHRIGASVDWLNLFEAGHSLGFRAVEGSDSGEVTFGELSYFMPFPSGVELRASAALYEYEASQGIAVLEPLGDGHSIRLQGSLPLKAGRALSLAAYAALEFKTLKQELLGTVISRDRLRVLEIGLELDATSSGGGRWIVASRLRRGLEGFMGGLENNDPDASRPGADGGYTRFSIDVTRLQAIGDGLSAVFRVYGQFTTEPLVVSEQIAVGGADSVRGYAPFEFIGDRGYTATGEIRVRLPWLERTHMEFAAFIDTGEGIRDKPAPGEQKSEVLSGGGVGLRLSQPNWGSVRIDVAWPISNPNPADGKEPRYYVSAAIHF